MNYKVLYRKYRPSNFDEVIGQNNSIKLLKDSIMSDKVAHAYIFSGPRGTGKTSTAKIFAKTLNCTNLKNGNPCEECEQCLNFNQSSDIYEIDAASNNGVDQIREIVDNIKLLPIHSKYKIYIIDEVHMLSINAFNALLLTLEEPPSHVIFILATTNVEAIPITILSRCQRLNFKKLSNDDLITNMRNISTKENIDITDEALKEIALYSDGGMRDALGVLDQLSKLNTTITLDVVQKELGFISDSAYEQLITDVEESNIDGITTAIDNLKNQSVDFKMSVKKLVNVLKAKCVYSLNNISTFSFDSYKKMCFELANSLNNINVNINSYDMLELILLGYTKNALNNGVPRHIDTVKTNSITENNDNQNILDNGNPNQNFKNLDTKIKKDDTKIENLDEKIKNFDNKTETNLNNLNSNFKNLDTKIENLTPKNLNSIVKIRINNCFVNCNKTFKNEMTTLWEEFKNNLTDRKLKSLILNSIVLAASEQIVLIKSDIDDQVDLINEQNETIAEKFNSIYNKTIKICCLDDKMWKEESKICMDKLKKGEKYEYIDENIDSDDNIDICDVFDTSVVEVK